MSDHQRFAQHQQAADTPVPAAELQRRIMLAIQRRIDGPTATLSELMALLDIVRPMVAAEKGDAS